MYGEVIIEKKEKYVTKLGPGKFFGERALVYHIVHQSTVKASTNVKCIVINSKSIMKALGCKLQEAIYENSKKIAMNTSKVFSHLQEIQKAKISEAINIKVYENNAVIIPSGEVLGHKLWIVIQGKLKSEGKIIAETYNVIGENELISGLAAILNQEIIADGEVHIGEIEKHNLQKCIGMNLDKIFGNVDLLKPLKQVSIFQHLSNEKLTSIACKLQVKEFNDKEVIFSQNSPGNQFFLIKSGRVDIIQAGILLRTERKTDYFGERSLLFDEARTASAISNGPTSCWILNREDFLQLFDERVIERFMKRIELQDTSLQLSDLKVIKLLGSGTFGNVYLVVDVIKHRLYALKTITKKKAQAYKIENHLLLEKNVLLSLDHSFVLKLIKTFKDSKRVYFLTEYVKGIDLFDVIRILNEIGEENSRFYIACLLIILEYLHKREIIFRDLKPENVIIDIEGYPKLIDFGAAKIIDERTFTITGTPHYMAPEVILGYGYSYAADYWSLGIMLYEFLYGNLPFGSDTDDPKLVYEAILERKIIYSPSIKVSGECISFINKLLSRKTLKRVNAIAEKKKAQSWLSHCDWEGLLNKEITPPYIPEFSHANDLIEHALTSDKTLDDMLSENEINEDQENFNIEVNSNWDSTF